LSIVSSVAGVSGSVTSNSEGFSSLRSHYFIFFILFSFPQSDFLLVVMRDMLRAYPSLRVVLMSATIDTSLFSSYFGNCPIIEIQGKIHPVQGLHTHTHIHTRTHTCTRHTAPSFLQSTSSRMPLKCCTSFLPHKTRRRRSGKLRRKRRM